VRGSSPSSRLLLLAAGALAGLVLAIVGIVLDSQSSARYLPPGAAARVEDRIITKEDYQRQLERLAADKRNVMVKADREHALNRLIEEELLILRGLEIGLAVSSPAVRKSIVSTMITQIVAESATEEPSRNELWQLYEKDRDFFTSPGRLRVTRLSMPSRETAEAAFAALDSGRSFEDVAQAMATDPVLPIPDSLMPPMKLVDYLGPTLTQAAMVLQPGEFSEPMFVGGAYQIVYVLDKESRAAPPFDEIREQVAAEYRRQAGDRALREYLDWLRDRADVAVAAGVTD
jgi:parvulin-like peptidyl-prolyl isomerase